MFASSRRIDLYAAWPISVITWFWPEVKFYVNLSRSSNTSFKLGQREKHDGVIADLSSLLVQKLFVKNNFRPKPLFLQYFTYRSLTVDLRSILMYALSTEEFKSCWLLFLIFFFLAISYHGTTARFLKNASFELWHLMTSGDPKIALREKGLKYFQTYLLIVVECFLLRLSNPLSFRVRRGW